MEFNFSHVKCLTCKNYFDSLIVDFDSLMMIDYDLMNFESLMMIDYDLINLTSLMSNV